MTGRTTLPPVEEGWSGGRFGWTDAWTLGQLEETNPTSPLQQNWIHFNLSTKWHQTYPMQIHLLNIISGCAVKAALCIPHPTHGYLEVHYIQSNLIEST